MKSQNQFLTTGLISFSVLTSFFFVWYGMNVVMSGRGTHSMTVFSYVTIAYGLANIAILSIAWSSRLTWASGASTFIALSYLGVFVMDSINAGKLDGVRLAVILLLSLVLALNWLTVRRVVSRN